MEQMGICYAQGFGHVVVQIACHSYHRVNVSKQQYSLMMNAGTWKINLLQFPPV